MGLIMVVFTYSTLAIAEEWRTPEALRAFGKPGDTVRDSSTAPPSAKPPKNKKTSQTSSKHATQDNSPSLRFDDTKLESMYGKTTPTELARQRQNAERIENEDRARETTKNAQNAKIRAIEKQRAEAELVKKQNEMAVEQQQQQLDARRQICWSSCDSDFNTCRDRSGGRKEVLYCGPAYENCKTRCTTMIQ